MTEKDLFKAIVSKLSELDKVTPGKMMSSPAIKWQTKVFAFFDTKAGEMVFRLGRDYDFAAHKLKTARVLQPFKNKGPLKDWFYIAATEKKSWEKLALASLERIKSGK